MSKKYVDIRINLDTLEEDDEEYTFVHSISLQKTKNLSESDLRSLGESLQQTDKYQILLSAGIPATIYSGEPSTPKEYS